MYDLQVTHYGLGGLCETHIDPYGYIEGAGLYESPEVQRLKVNLFYRVS